MIIEKNKIQENDSPTLAKNIINACQEGRNEVDSNIKGVATISLQPVLPICSKELGCRIKAFNLKENAQF